MAEGRKNEEIVLIAQMENPISSLSRGTSLNRWLLRSMVNPTRAIKISQCKHELISYDALPEFLKDNEFVSNYYRSEWPLKQTILSIFSIHNETLNIWIHHKRCTVAEILKNNGFVVEKKITTSAISPKDESGGRSHQKAKIEILLGKSDKFDQLMASDQVKGETYGQEN